MRRNRMRIINWMWREYEKTQDHEENKEDKEVEEDEKEEDKMEKEEEEEEAFDTSAAAGLRSTALTRSCFVEAPRAGGWRRRRRRAEGG
eukprot:25487-Pyramimonas_sp.AAC.1